MSLKGISEAIARKEQVILWAAFRKHNTEIATWVRSSASKLSITTWSAVLNHAKPTDLRTLLIMCSELEISMAQVKKMIIARGENEIADMLKED